MLGELLRRLLWLPPMALLVSALTFALVTSKPGPSSSVYSHLPLFFNSQPGDASTRARRALARLAQGEAEDDARALQKLGGAALPVVLPALEGLSPEARRRVAAALRPLGARMSLALDRSSPDAEVLGWQRFWEDRALDFRAPTIRRMARRYAQNPTETRRVELQLLDTAALEELFAVLGPDGPLPPAPLAATLVPVIQRALGTATAPLAGTALDDEVLALRAFWFAHRIEYETLDAPGRASALLLETQYGKWVERTVLERAVRSPRASVRSSSPLRTLLRRGRMTLARVLLGLVVGVMLAWVAAMLSRGGRSGKLRVALAAGLALVPLVVASSSEWPSVVSVLLIGVATALAASRRVIRLLEAELGRPSATTALAVGMSARGAAWRVLWMRLPALLGRVMVAELSVALSVALLVEWRWKIQGLGSAILDALRDQDATVLMSLTVACSVVVQLAAATADTIDELRDRRLRGHP